MLFVSRRAGLKLNDKETEMLTTLSQSRSEPAGRAQRASILLRVSLRKSVMSRIPPSRSAKSEVWVRLPRQTRWK